jgi:hypothetical protein
MILTLNPGFISVPLLSLKPIADGNPPKAACIIFKGRILPFYALMNFDMHKSEKGGIPIKNKIIREKKAVNSVVPDFCLDLHISDKLYKQIQGPLILLIGYVL